MITNTNTSKQLKNKRQEASKFNVLWFKNYDGTTTLKVVTREQYNRSLFLGASTITSLTWSATCHNRGTESMIN